MSANVPNNLEQELKQIIANVIGRNADELKPTADFWKDLGVDSIKAIEIIVAIEKRYKITVRDEEVPKISNVGQVIEVVKKALKSKIAK